MKRTYQPSTLKRLRKFGFLKRNKLHKKILYKRRLKNRKYLTISDKK
ncbi:MAG: 50S ribosomal protein L34 [Candidatus Shikimatogenerans bostrichidophilus]|nr:MAG: 50S ribosomal protein L34 [Candidatus Shikimatogenerans bostrichidophilus]